MAASGSDDGDVRAALATIRGAQSDLVARTLQANIRRDLLGKDESPLKIDRFVIVAPLASGAAGTVFRAYDPQLDRAIALKLVGDGDAQAIREARALARLAHPNVVTVHDAGVTDAQAWIAMELVAGTTLREHFAQARRRWRATAELFIAAGRGLAAAHSAGIVHRDFKPDNVLLGEDGRVCVADFGLAHAREAAVAEADRRPGTPAYMAPEQLAGQAVDAKSDQFAYCVALFEGLQGRRPFETSAIDARLQEIRGGPGPLGGAPRWLRRIVARGLAFDAQQRFDSMDALVDQLQRGLGRRQRQLIVAGGVTAVAIAVGYPALGPTPTDPCAGADAPPGEAWDDARRTAVAEVANRSDEPAVRKIWAATESALDDYAARWSAARRDACEARLVRREQTTRQLSLRTQCLQRARQDLDSFTAALARADTQALLRARSGVAALPSLSTCGNVEVLELVGHVESTPAVESIRQRLSEAKATLHTGDYAAAQRLAEPLEVDARAIDSAPLLAEVLLVAGDIAQRTGDATLAEAKLREALWAAEGSRHEQAAATAATVLVLVVGAVQHRPDRGLEWGEHARMANSRMGIADGMTGHLAYALGSVYAAAGRGDALERVARQQLRIAEDQSSDLMGAGAHSNLAIAARIRGDLSSAAEHGETALALTTATWGAGHPNVAAQLNNLANIYADLADYDASLSRYEQAIEIWRRPPTRGRSRLPAALMNAGLVLKEVDRFAEAEASVEESLELYRALHGPEHPDVASAQLAAGQVKQAMHDPRGARVRFDAALTLLRRSEAHNGPMVPHALLGLGQSALALDAPADAIDPLEDAWTRVETVSVSSHTRASIAFALGRALWDANRDRTRGRALVQRSLALVDDNPSPLAAAHVSEARAWLEEVAGN